MSHNNSSIDENELKKFNKTMEEWWDLDGEFKPLHQINPARIEYINSVISLHFKDITSLKLLDVGCGGGVASVALSSCGYNVIGLDANESNIDAARKYTDRNQLDIEYIHSTVEDYVKTNIQYDVVVCLEVLEHVANPKDFMLNIAKLVRDGGIVIFSTINRTKKAYLLAIVMAEYVLGWVKKYTHDYSKFVKPSEIVDMAQGTKLELKELKGLSFSPLSNNWFITDDIDVNYFAVFSN